MENLSDNLRRLHEETLQWRNPEQHMEDEEQGREGHVILHSLLHEVPFTQSPASETVPISAESLTQIPISTPGPNLVRNEPVSTVDFGNGEHRIPFPAVSTNESVQNAQSAAQSSFGGFKFQGNFSSQSRPEFNVGAIPASTYPGLDGHPRRITPIPISEGQFQPDEIREGYEQVAKTLFGAKIHDPMRTEESTERTSGTIRPTIGSTTISTEQAEMIKKEVRDCVRQVFPGIKLSTDYPVSLNMRFGKNRSGNLMLT